jgi:hypothetical protein
MALIAPVSTKSTIFIAFVWAPPVPNFVQMSGRDVEGKVKMSITCQVRYNFTAPILR